jgi:hypothetical protein
MLETGVLDLDRTGDLQFRKLLLYPTELRGRAIKLFLNRNNFCCKQTVGIPARNGVNSEQRNDLDDAVAPVNGVKCYPEVGYRSILRSQPSILSEATHRRARLCS